MGAEAVSHRDILDAVQALAKTVGGETLNVETGQVVATGMFARFRAIEARDQAQEMAALRWRNRILGVTAAAGVCAAVVTYFAGDRVDGIRDTIRNPPAATAPAKK